MQLTASRNMIAEGKPGWFHIGSNRLQYFEIGERLSNTLWLEGDSVGTKNTPEFVFNGRLYLPAIKTAATIIDNFPRAPAPDGWTIVKHVHYEGYDLVSEKTGETIFGFRVDSKVCFITTNLYGSQSELWAESSQDALILHRAPARLGTYGIRLS